MADSLHLGQAPASLLSALAPTRSLLALPSALYPAAGARLTRDQTWG